MRKSLVSEINWQKCNNLVPAIIQDQKTLEVLMLGFMNKEALILTEKTDRVHFWSRTKGRIWMKGEDSGHVLNVIEIKADCDMDSILILAIPTGNTCHNDIKSCFNLKTNFLAELEEIIDQRIINSNEKSYVSQLSKKGLNKVVQKIGEEATEAVIAALTETDDRFVEESADLLFHLIMALKIKKLSLNNVIEALKERNKEYER